MSAAGEPEKRPFYVLTQPLIKVRGHDVLLQCVLPPSTADALDRDPGRTRALAQHAVDRYRQ